MEQSSNSLLWHSGHFTPTYISALFLWDEIFKIIFLKDVIFITERQRWSKSWLCPFPGGDFDHIT